MTLSRSCWTGTSVARWSPVLMALLAGCGGEGQEPESTEPPASCDAPQIALPDGACIRPGIPPDGCDPGFVHDGEYGCEPVLPSEPCPDGWMAVPGEPECRPVATCEPGRWGGIPTDEATEHVDGSYVGGNSDGSAERPWTTIGEGVAAVAAGAIVAVAAGRYHEDIRIATKPVRLWGTCPEEVELIGSGAELSALTIVRQESWGTEVRRLAITGEGGGIGLAGAPNVTVDQVWVHDTASLGVDVLPYLGESSLHLRGSLIERATHGGVFAAGSELTVAASVVRGTAPLSNSTLGRGISFDVLCSTSGCDPASASRGSVSGSLVEQNHEVGIFISSSDAAVQGTVVRDTLPRAANQELGIGVAFNNPCANGICDPAARAHGTLTGSLIERNHELGVAVFGSDLSMDRTVVRHTLPRASDQQFGWAINVQTGVDAIGLYDPTARGAATIERSLLQANVMVGLQIAGSDVLVRDLVVRDSALGLKDQRGGRGINVQPVCMPPLACDSTTTSTLDLSGGLIERSIEVGLFALGSDATLQALAVRATSARPSDQLFGDGISVFSEPAPATAWLTNVIIDDSERAGIGSFGAHVWLGNTQVRCGAFDFAGEHHELTPFVFEDTGGNRCGCPETTGECSVVSAGLEPPSPLAAH